MDRNIVKVLGIVAFAGVYVVASAGNASAEPITTALAAVFTGFGFSSAFAATLASFTLTTILSIPCDERIYLSPRVKP